MEHADRPHEAVFRFTVRARSHPEATRLVLAALRRVDEAVPPRGDGPACAPMGWTPMDDIRPARPAP